MEKRKRLTSESCETISGKMLFALLAIELFAMNSLMLPSVLVGYAGQNGLPVLAAASGLLLLQAVFYGNCLKEKKRTPDQIVEKEVAVGTGLLIKIVFWVRYFLHSLFLMLLFADLIGKVLLPQMNRIFILFPLAGLLYQISEKKLTVRGRIGEVLFPFVFLALFLVLIPALRQVDYGETVNQVICMDDWKDTAVFSGIKSVYGMLTFYQPIEFFLFLGPCVQKSKRKTQKGKTVLKKYVIAACLFAAVVNGMMFVAAVGLFGTKRIGNNLWSALYIMQNVRLPGNFIERLDLLFLAFWIFAAFVLLSAYIYYGSRFFPYKKIQLTTDETNMHTPCEENRRFDITLWLVSLLAIAMICLDLRKYFEFYAAYKMWIDFPAAVFVPLYLYRKKGGHSKERNGVRKKKTAMMILVLTGLLLTGCQDSVDIEERNFVMTLVVEKGEEKRFRILYETAELSGEKQDGGSRSGKITVYEADSLEEAELLDKERADKRLDYGHLKTIVLSKEMMEEEWLFQVWMEEVEKKREIAGTTLVFVTMGDGRKLLELGEEKASSFGEYMADMINCRSQSGNQGDTIGAWLKDYAEQKSIRKINRIEAENDSLVLKQEEWSFADSLSILAQSVVRFHIRASGNTAEEQKTKERVRDEIFPKIQQLLSGCTSKADCILRLEESKKLLEQWAADAYADAKVAVLREWFPEKTYGDMTFPEGIYDALRVDLGQAQGENWWCMMYPSLCLQDGVVEKVSEEGKEVLEESLPEEEYRGLFRKSERKYRIKWKIGEYIRGLWDDFYVFDKKLEKRK